MSQQAIARVNYRPLYIGLGLFGLLFAWFISDRINNRVSTSQQHDQNPAHGLSPGANGQLRHALPALNVNQQRVVPRGVQREGNRRAIRPERQNQVENQIENRGLRRANMGNGMNMNAVNMNRMANQAAMRETWGPDGLQAVVELPLDIAVVAVASTGTALTSPVSPEFGLSPYFILIDMKMNTFRVAQNAGGTSQQVVQDLVDLGAEAVISGNVDRRANQSMLTLKMRNFPGVRGSVRDAIVAFRNGKLVVRAQREQEAGPAARRLTF